MKVIIMLWFISINKGQTGTSWLPAPNSTDPKQNLDRVNTLVILFSIQFAFNVIVVIGIVGSTAKASRTSGDQTVDKKQVDPRWILP